jgi:hypothetical protein
MVGRPSFIEADDYTVSPQPAFTELLIVGSTSFFMMSSGSPGLSSGACRPLCLLAKAVTRAQPVSP